MSAVVSEKPPTPEEIETSAKLRECLSPFHVFDTEEGMLKRRSVLARMNEIVQQWVKSVSETHYGMTDTSNVSAKMFTFGSFRLDVHNQEGDIDTLLCFPRHVERSAFFESFFAVLQQHEDVTELHAAESAFVPAIKCRFDGIEMDILFARLNYAEIPDDLSLDETDILRHLSPECVRSVNGPRVTDAILKHVSNDPASFSLALRTIKLWAKHRGIYSNTLGYFGGVHLAILVARVCQMFPKAVGSTIVEKFFWVYSKWDWSIPIQLREIQYDSTLNLPQWDPRYNPRDKDHLMPIITPAYPQSNAAFNVTKSTRQVIVSEFKRGYQIVDSILKTGSEWLKLWSPTPFFTDNRRFFRVSALANSEEDRTEFEGLVESLIRFFTSRLEETPNCQSAFPFPKRYHSVDTASDTPIYATNWFVAFALVDSKGGLDIKPAAQDFYSRTTQRKQTMRTQNDGMNSTIKVMTAKDLPLYVFPDGQRPKKEKKAKRKSNSIGTSASSTSKAGAPPTSAVAPRAASSKDAAAGASNPVRGSSPKAARQELDPAVLAPAPVAQQHRKMTLKL